MWSLSQRWRTAGRRPLSVRGHLIWLAFWLALAALLAYRLLTGDAEPGFFFFLIAAAVLTNFAVLLLSYRDTPRDPMQRSDRDSDPEGTTGAP